MCNNQRYQFRKKIDIRITPIYIYAKETENCNNQHPIRFYTVICYYENPFLYKKLVIPNVSLKISINHKIIKLTKRGFK